MIYDHKDFYLSKDRAILLQAKEIKKTANEWIDRFDAAESTFSKRGYHVELQVLHEYADLSKSYLLAVVKNTKGLVPITDDIPIQELIANEAKDEPDTVLSALVLYANTSTSSFDVVRILESLIVTQ